MPSKALIKVGLVILTMAILSPWVSGFWLRTRRFQPVDMAVYLPVGSLQTTQFATNLRGDYYVRFSADDAISYATMNRCSAVAWREVRWTLYRLSGDATKTREPWASNRNPVGDELIWGFHGPTGKYELEWEIPPEASCLNTGHPHLLVYTSSETYDQANGLLRFLSPVFAGAGLMLVLRGLGGFLRRRLAGTQTIRMLPELTLRNVLPVRPANGGGPMAPMIHLSNFTIVWSCILGVLLFFNVSITSPTHYGVFVKIDERGTVALQKSPWPETMSVYVGVDNRFYVNSKLVAPEELRTKLMEELGRQMVWTVYFEADESSLFGKAVYAMDAIKGVGAKVVWITPKVREELNSQAARGYSSSQ
jgi:biopolymer transport protein ExbD